MKNSNLVRKNFYITVIQWEKFESVSQKTGLTISEHIRRAIDSYIEDFDAKERSDLNGSTYIE